MQLYKNHLFTLVSQEPLWYYESCFQESSSKNLNYCSKSSNPPNFMAVNIRRFTVTYYENLLKLANWLRKMIPYFHSRLAYEVLIRMMGNNSPLAIITVKLVPHESNFHQICLIKLFDQTNLMTQQLLQTNLVHLNQQKTFESLIKQKSFVWSNKFDGNLIVWEQLNTFYFRESKFSRIRHLDQFGHHCWIHFCKPVFKFWKSDKN